MATILYVYAGIWFLWSKKTIVIFQKEKGNTFTLLTIFMKSLQKEQNGTNLLLWPPICRNKPAITPKWFNSYETNFRFPRNFHENNFPTIVDDKVAFMNWMKTRETTTHLLYFVVIIMSSPIKPSLFRVTLDFSNSCIFNSKFGVLFSSKYVSCET